VAVADPALAIVSLLPVATFKQLFNNVALEQIRALAQSEDYCVCLLLHPRVCLSFLEVQNRFMHI
jgi:hypothetical protein